MSINLDSNLCPYEVEINGEVVQLSIDALRLIKKELKSAIQTKQMEDAIYKAIKSVKK
jgi:hypothetical protein